MSLSGVCIQTFHGYGCWISATQNCSLQVTDREFPWSILDDLIFILIHYFCTFRSCGECDTSQNRAQNTKEHLCILHMFGVLSFDCPRSCTLCIDNLHRFFLCCQSVCGKMSFLQMKCWWWSLFLAPRMYGALHILLDEPVSDFKFEVQVDLFFFLGLGLSRLWGCCRLLCLACVRRVLYTTLWSCSLMSMLVLSGQPNQHLPYTNYIHK